MSSGDILNTDVTTSWVNQKVYSLMTSEEIGLLQNYMQQINVLQHAQNTKRRQEQLLSKGATIIDKAISKFVSQYNAGVYAEKVRAEAIRLIQNQIENNESEKSVWNDSLTYWQTTQYANQKEEIQEKKSQIYNLAITTCVGIHLTILEKWQSDIQPIYDKVNEWLTIIDPESVSKYIPTNNNLGMVKTILGCNADTKKLKNLTGSAQFTKVTEYGYFQKAIKDGLCDIYIQGYDQLTQRKDDTALKIFNELIIEANETCIYKGESYNMRDPFEYIGTRDKLPFVFLPYQHFVDRGIYSDKKNVLSQIDDVLQILAGLEVKGDIYGYVHNKESHKKLNSYAPLFISLSPKDDGIFMALNPALPTYYYTQEYIPFLNAFNQLSSMGYKLADYLTKILRINADKFAKNGFIDISMRTIKNNGLYITADESDTKHAGERIKKPIVEALRNIKDVQTQVNGYEFIILEYDDTLPPSKFLDSKLRIKAQGMMSKYLEKVAFDKTKKLERQRKARAEKQKNTLGTKCKKTAKN